MVVTFHLVCLGWLMFRATSVPQVTGQRLRESNLCELPRADEDRAEDRAQKPEFPADAALGCPPCPDSGVCCS